MRENDMIGWRIAGVVATLVIVLTIPLYLFKTDDPAERMDGAGGAPAAVFVTSEKCKSCHRPEYDKWKDSHHYKAMARASEESVLGDFDNAVFEWAGVQTRFYRDKGKFYVHTRGPGGVMGDFEAAYTFGFTPLQQYLVPFPGGRLQCLPIAWDVIQKRWYHLYPDQDIDPDDWMYWTNAAQNWNGMCAECHSTRLEKNYDPAGDAYATTWSEINVGCEACHGPGSAHVKWAEMPEMARPAAENFGLVVRTGGADPRPRVELCAPCHARRMPLGNNTHQYTDFMNQGIPMLLEERLYFADGQILDEVYVYGSFVQSKMYERGVTCGDCHDVHAARRHMEGNDLCLQCHKAALYDTRDHHFHKKAGEKGEPIRGTDGAILFDVGTGASCEQCHMPGRLYMGIDYRPDHGFRRPRPDLSLKIQTPDACVRCHADKTSRWAAEWTRKWFGEKRRPHYGEILAEGRRGSPGAAAALIRLAEDPLYPTIVRAEALSLLASRPEPEIHAVFEKAMVDEEALIRYTAIRNLPTPDSRARFRIIAPLLYDPVKAVRIEAAARLASVPGEWMDEPVKARFQRVLEEYRRAMEYTADFAASRHNLGNLYATLGQWEPAMENYRKAIEIDALFYPAKVNLAMLYNQMEKKQETERLLREVVADHPDLHEIHYSLGLLLVERKRPREAEIHLSRAAEGLPGRARIHYNLGLLRQSLGKDDTAEIALKRAVEIAPRNLDFLYALAEFYLKRGRWPEAQRVAEAMLAAAPDHEMGRKILDYIKKQTGP
ncbi:MAG: tetratricopeptide repeat protein [Desulfobacterales bacterium]|nr:tetratricopeptide repeat protein [Desulfobacterales bacterium]